MIGEHHLRNVLKVSKVYSRPQIKYSHFQFVMRNLVKRYIAQMQRCKQRSEGVSEDDVNEIKQVLLVVTAVLKVYCMIKMLIKFCFKMFYNFCLLL